MLRCNSGFDSLRRQNVVSYRLLSTLAVCLLLPCSYQGVALICSVVMSCQCWAEYPQGKQVIHRLKTDDLTWKARLTLRRYNATTIRELRHNSAVYHLSTPVLNVYCIQQTLTLLCTWVLLSSCWNFWSKVSGWCNLPTMTGSSAIMMSPITRRRVAKTPIPCVSEGLEIVNCWRYDWPNVWQCHPQCCGSASGTFGRIQNWYILDPDTGQRW